MRVLLVGLAMLALSGCEQNGRYQLASGGGVGAGVWRLDTRTGEVTVCGVNLGGRRDGKIACVPGF
jgi:hypothetical protein